ncbi:MAG: hypothetical protein DMF83_26480 [Acidobacteria bacterium]|nr:MAG: hypothetical protein DMF83_26480 [Acidobacteriota bacterium]
MGDPAAAVPMVSLEGLSVGLAAGSRRTDDDTSGLGKCATMTSSTWRLLLPAAAARSALWLAAVRCGARSRTLVRFSEPSPSMSRTIGNLRPTSAATMRLYASCSERRRTSVQYVKSDEKPAAR